MTVMGEGRGVWGEAGAKVTDRKAQLEPYLNFSPASWPTRTKSSKLIICIGERERERVGENRRESEREREREINGHTCDRLATR